MLFLTLLAWPLKSVVFKMLLVVLCKAHQQRSSVGLQITTGSMPFAYIVVRI